MSNAGDIEKLVKEAQAQGFRVEDKGSKWFVFSNSDPKLFVTIHKPHGNSGDPNVVRRMLRKVGVNF